MGRMKDSSATVSDNVGLYQRLSPGVGHVWVAALGLWMWRR
jgi:hypothetical protein